MENLEVERKAVKYYEVRVYGKNGKLYDRTRLKAYPDEWATRQMIEMVGGAYCTVTDYYRIEPVKKSFVTPLEAIKDSDKWIHYRIWNPNMDDCIPYEGSVEYPYNRLGLISVVKIASYCGLMVVFTSDNKDAEHWANWYAWGYDCSPLDFSEEEKEPDDDCFWD